MIDHTNLDTEQGRAALRLMVEHGYTFDAANQMIESSSVEALAATTAQLSERGYREWCRAHKLRALYYALGGPAF